MLQRFTNLAGAASTPIVDGIARPTLRPEPASLDTAKAKLTREASDAAAPLAITPGD